MPFPCVPTSFNLFASQHATPVSPPTIMNMIEPDLDKNAPIAFASRLLSRSFCSSNTYWSLPSAADRYAALSDVNRAGGTNVYEHVADHRE